jgi:hypothetical protein
MRRPPVRIVNEDQPRATTVPAACNVPVVPVAGREAASSGWAATAPGTPTAAESIAAQASARKRARRRFTVRSTGVRRMTVRARQHVSAPR